MTAAADIMHAIQIDDDGRLDQNMPCVGCQYNLRGLSPRGTCPECGRPVEHAVRVARLGRRDPNYLRRIAFGMAWLTIGSACMLLLVICGYVWLFTRGAMRPINVIGIFLFGVGVVTCIIGFVHVTAPHLLDHEREPWYCRRRVARFAMTVGFAMPVTCIAAVEFTHPQVWVTAWLICFVLLAIGAWTMFGHGARLASQIDHRAMAYQSRGVGIGLTLNVALPLLYLAAHYPQPTVFQLLLGTNVTLITPEQLLKIAGMPAAVLIAWTVPLLVWYRQRLLEAAKMSEAALPEARPVDPQ